MIGDTSHVTEIFCQDWLDEPAEIDQVFQVTLQGHGVSANAYEDPDHWRVPPDSPEIPYTI